MTLKRSASPQQTSRKGFTLIELSIVLVIIGLIVGGVLVGQDLIKAAEIRATVGQVEKLNAAVNTFRTKYNGIPGDLSAATATAFGLFSTGMTGGDGLGDGDGLVEGAASAAVNLGDSIVFWRHLSDTTLVEGSFGGQMATGGAANADLTTSTISNYFLPAKLGRGNHFSVNQNSGVNYYLLSGMSAVTAASGATTYTTVLTPVEAYNIDTKLDDGAPNTGIVLARGTTTPFSPVATSQATWSAGPTTECMTGGGAATASTTTFNRSASTGGNTPACGLRIRFN
jgi:prepilin-type N-terminal cleavage/methylation domain-containing protein